MLNDLQIAWVNDVRHLGNYINKSLSDKLGCQQNYLHLLVALTN